MIRERALRVVLVLEGLLFLAAIYPITTNIWDKQSEGFTMMLSIYFALGIFLLIAVPNPRAHRSLIAFAGWANIAHALVMAVMAIGDANDRKDLLQAVGLCVLVGVPLIALTPAKHSTERKLTVAAG